MKLVIDIPEWAQERHIYVMAGIEMLAYKLYGEDQFHVKTSRCSQCGECCMDLKINMEPIGPDNNCIHLAGPIGGKYDCGLLIRRPFGCSVGMQCKGEYDHPSCTVEYKAIDL